MRPLLLLILIFLLITHAAHTWSIFGSPSNETTTTPSAPSNSKFPPPRTPPVGAPSTTTESSSNTFSFITSIMDQVSGKIAGVTEVVGKAVTAATTYGQEVSLEKLRDIQKQVMGLGERIKNLDFYNLTDVSSGLQEVGGKLFGISGNATEVKQQFLNAAVQAVTDGVLCKTPAELATSAVQGMLGNLLGNISGNGSGVGIFVGKNLVTAGLLTGDLAKAAEGAGTLSTGLGLAVGAGKCLGNIGGVLAPLLLLG